MTAIRVVHDISPAFDLEILFPEKCRKPVDLDHVCFLRRKHDGRCLPAPWPRQDVSPSNPPVPRKPVEK